MQLSHILSTAAVEFDPSNEKCTYDVVHRRLVSDIRYALDLWLSGEILCLQRWSWVRQAMSRSFNFREFLAMLRIEPHEKNAGREKKEGGQGERKRWQGELPSSAL